MSNKKFKIGDSVKVEKGIMDYNIPELCIEGWQGRVFDLIREDDGRQLVGIKWDSITLLNIPGEYIDKFEQRGYDWSKYYEHAENLEPASPRDTEKDAENAFGELFDKHRWAALGEQGKRIREVLGETYSSGITGFDAWDDYLEEKLSFPFMTKVVECDVPNAFDYGVKLEVRGLSDTDDMYGIIVEARRGRKKCYYPLCELEVINKKNKNYQPVKDYVVWFANR
jgi:hypothetical protein